MYVQLTEGARCFRRGLDGMQALVPTELFIGSSTVVYLQNTEKVNFDNREQDGRPFFYKDPNDIFYFLEEEIKGHWKQVVFGGIQ